MSLVGRLSAVQLADLPRVIDFFAYWAPLQMLDLQSRQTLPFIDRLVFIVSPRRFPVHFRAHLQRDRCTRGRFRVFIEGSPAAIAEKFGTGEVVVVSAAHRAASQSLSG